MDFHSLWEGENAPLRRHIIPLSLGVLGLIFLGYGLIWSLNSSPASDGISFQSAESTSSAELTSVKISIDIEGAVAHPGVYELSSGSRLRDALTASGGFSSEADEEWIAKHMNLAAKLSDGVKVYVPKIGETATNGVQSTAGSNGAVVGPPCCEAGSLSTVDGLININTASRSELDTLPGIGSVTAEKIINGRPYGTIEDLLSRKIVTAKVFGQIKDKIIAN